MPADFGEDSWNLEKMFDFGLDQNLLTNQTLERMATDDSNQILSNVESPTFQLQILPTHDDLQKNRVHDEKKPADLLERAVNMNNITSSITDESLDHGNHYDQAIKTYQGNIFDCKSKTICRYKKSKILCSSNFVIKKHVQRKKSRKIKNLAFQVRITTVSFCHELIQREFSIFAFGKKPWSQILH